ncbi:hypothetical protein P0R36_02885, partial [Aeromonas caviae]|uniref:hypothetical protein n=1 Tax=Aeromonas caviae TaxID=648 RepID=UPI0023DC794A
VSMMEALRVMTYFKVSLSTCNWDSAILKPIILFMTFAPARISPATCALPACKEAPCVAVTWGWGSHDLLADFGNHAL